MDGVYLMILKARLVLVVMGGTVGVLSLLASGLYGLWKDR